MSTVLFNNNEFEDQEFSGVEVNECDLSGKEFEYCSFEGCVFDSVRLKHAVFENCKFISSSLMMTDVKQATFDGVIFKGCKITGINFSELNTFRMSLAFFNTKLLSCSFIGLDLPETPFEASVIDDTIFRECNLKNSSFKNTLFNSTTFSSNNLSKTNFKDATGFLINPCDNDLKGAIFTHLSAFELLKPFNLTIE